MAIFIKPSVRVFRFVDEVTKAKDMPVVRISKIASKLRMSEEEVIKAIELSKELKTDGTLVWIHNREV